MAVLLFICACDDDTAQTETNKSYVDASASLFSLDKDEVMQVVIDIDPQDWDMLRYESPGLDHYLDPECPNGPRERPFRWYSATVSVNSRNFGQIEIRKKGFKGSMEPMKPSIKLRFQDDNRAFGIRRMTLNNTVQDMTWSRQCLAYHLFRKAGLAAPRCGLAAVTVNGKDLGIYTHVEEIKSPLLKSHFGDSNGELYEITMADFVPELLVMFEYKGNDDNVNRSYLEKLTAALQADDEQLFDEVKKYLALDDFFTFWAMEAVTAHWDSYSGNRNNSYLYRDSNDGLFYFIPWGTDASFRKPLSFWEQFRQPGDTWMPWAVYAHGEIANRLYAHPEGRKRYEARIRDLLSEVWDEDELIDMVDNIIEAISPRLANDDLRAISEAEAVRLKEFIRTHRSRIIDELDAGLDDWTLPPGPALCSDAVIDSSGNPQTRMVFEGTVKTKFGTGEEQIMTVECEGNVTEIADGKENVLPMIKAVIDYQEDPKGWRNVLLIIGFGPTVTKGDFAMIGILMPEELFYTGNTIRLDMGEARNEVFWEDVDILLPILLGEEKFENAQEDPEIHAGFVVTGELTLDEVDPTSGGIVKFTFKAPLGTLKVSEVQKKRVRP